jgi:hypothetical protein
MNELHDQPESSATPADAGGAGTSAAATAADRSLPTSRVLGAFAATQDVEALLHACLAALRETIPQLVSWRGRVSGRRALGAHTPPQHGRPVQLDYTRVDFEFKVDATAEPVSVALTRRSTIRGRDLPAAHALIPLADGGGARVGRWIESELLDFATRFFASRHRSPRGRA